MTGGESAVNQVETDRGIAQGELTKPSARFCHRQVETHDGVCLHVITAGDEDAPLVVLLHGFPEDCFGWRHQITPLVEAGFRVWVPDQRGYGESDRLPRVRDYALDRLSDDVVDLIDAAGVERAAVVGHDWGAAVAWWTAARHPARITRLGILNVPHPMAMERALLRSPAQMLRSWYIVFFQIPWLPEWLIGLRRGALVARTLRGSSRPGTFTDADLEHYRAAWSRPGALRAMIHWYRSAARRHSRLEDPQIHCPVRILWGVRDAFLGVELAHASLEHCDAGELTLFENATHWLQHEEPDAVNRALIDFLSDDRTAP